jgi:hypothetical protein
MFRDGGLALLWRQVLSLPTVHSILGVDSAEADKVGSQGFRFCAYADCAPYRGVWHRRTTSVRYCGLLYCCGDVRSQWAAAGFIGGLSASPAVYRCSLWPSPPFWLRLSVNVTGVFCVDLGCNLFSFAFFLFQPSAGIS